ncbi:Crossover junction endonuclease MUS81 [Yarrowia sp. B02]|nr:Crossover junction endonuclease MUS81 [Yarrowia sp. B02]
MSKKSILNDLIIATEADLSLAKSVSAISKKARLFSDQLEVLRKVQKGMDGPLIFKVCDLKKYMDTKSLGVLETRWNKVLEKRQEARDQAELEKRQQDETAVKERERIKQAAQDVVLREHEQALEKLRKEKNKGGRGVSGFTDPLPTASIDLTDDVDLTATETSPASSYFPKRGTAAHDLLVAMISLPNPTTKEQVLKVTGSQKSWGGLAKLKSEGLVTSSKLNNVYTYSLTASGKSLAENLRGIVRQDKRVADELREDLGRQKRPKATSRVDVHGYYAEKSKAPSAAPKRYADEDMDVHVVPISDGATVAAAELRKAGVAQAEPTEATWEPSSYEIVLLVDKRENNREEAQQAISGLSQKKVTVVPSVLYLGDFLFAARHKSSKKMAVLNTIIERKRYDDLNSSIVDSRYEEQKSRLRKCGVDNVIYLVEHYSMSRAAVQIREKAIASILGRVVAIDGFLLKKTKNVLESCDYMASLYESIKACFEGVSLEIGPQKIGGFSSSRDSFSTMMLTAWQDKNLKSNHSLKVLFIQMLMTINGISAEKAQAIQKLFPTPRHLIDKYREVDESVGKTYLELATKGDIKSVGKAASEMVYEVFGKL